MRLTSYVEFPPKTCPCGRRVSLNVLCCSACGHEFDENEVARKTNEFYMLSDEDRREAILAGDGT